MTSITDNLFYECCFLIGGCVLSIIIYLVIRPNLQHRYWLRIENRINEMIDHQIEQHRNSCPMKQTNVHHSLYYGKPETKAQSKEMLYSFMMTYYPQFLKALRDSTATSLTSTEENICFLIKLGVCNKNISESMKVSVNSVFKTRYRIKQKLNIPSEGDDLTRYIQQQGEPLSKLPPGYIIFTEEKPIESPNDQA